MRIDSEFYLPLRFQTPGKQHMTVQCMVTKATHTQHMLFASKHLQQLTKLTNLTYVQIVTANNLKQ